MLKWLVGSFNKANYIFLDFQTCSVTAIKPASVTEKELPLLRSRPGPQSYISDRH